MTGQEQRAALQRKIWDIANDVRGSVDGWDFKQYVLGTLFYRFISENFAAYIAADDESINYAGLPDNVVTDDIKDDAIKTKGYFIYPSQLFANVAKNANTNDSLNTDLAQVFAAIESSANGYPSELDIKGLFADFDTTSTRLGNTVTEKNSRLAKVLKRVAELDFGDFHNSQIDLFGDAYEFLISNYAANAGKSGGEFFTPQHVSKLIAQLAMHGQEKVNKIYDPACGSGSLLLQAKKHFDAHIIEEGFFGQEINHTTYNLARMNMFLHNINYDKFNIQRGDTLTQPHFQDDKPFDAIVSNPPYSVKWIGSDDPTLINDDRFAPAGVLAPKSKADFAFVLHALSYLSAKGRAAIVCFPGIFYRDGAEKKIRQYLVDNNYVETVIALASNLFYGTTIAVTILVLAKNKTDTAIQFIDATGEEFFKKATNTNLMTDEHIGRVMEIFDSKQDVDHVAASVPYETVVERGYNLSVSSYVEPRDTREIVNIGELNEEIKAKVEKIDQLRTNIDAIIVEIDANEAQSMSAAGFLDKLLNGAEVAWVPLGDDNYFELANTARRPVKASLRAAGDIPYYGANNIQDYVDGHTHNGEYVLIAEDGSASLENYSIQYVSGKFWANNHVHVVRGTDAVDTRFLFHCLTTTNFLPFLSSKGRAKLTKGNLVQITVPIPCPSDPEKSLAIQGEIVRILDSFAALAAELSAELSARKKQYTHYRDLLLSFPKPDDMAT
ncbi:type I restriction-modification system subunit M [Pararhodobacter zhoushanensis]|uniref:type I restriction-modification system subunit M n=1 Tax=Pararhodobacter zhoushanensis TaxID=2479545 RepID=UPI000F8EB3A1|nr:type I restriction-modification system subunit M [Pararhodobacter zhoushanensis]